MSPKRSLQSVWRFASSSGVTAIASAAVSSTHSTRLQLVASSRLLDYTSRSALPSAAESFGLKALSVKELAWRRAVSVTYREDAYLSPAARLFIGSIKAVAARRRASSSDGFRIHAYRAELRSRAPETPSIGRGIAGLALAVVGWGLTWPINKVLLGSISPFWLSAFRAAIASVVLFAIAVASRRLIVPARHDMPIVVSIALLHMVGFSVLAAIGLSLVPVGRSVVLAYTTPLWVMPAAAIFLGERLTGRRLVGVVLGLLGLMVLFNPFAFDWSDRSSLAGHAALLVAALLWASNMVHVRGHQWQATPFQLVPWEMLLATAVLFVIAILSGATAAIEWNASVVLLLLASSILGQALPQWAVVVAGRGLSAGTVSLGLLASPIIGIVVAAAALGEPLDVYVWLAVFLVIGGVALGTTGSLRR